MTQLQHAFPVHTAPGRMRLHVPSMRGDAAFFAELQHSVEAVAVAGNVHVNCATASILLEGINLCPLELQALARSQQWFEVVLGAPQPQTSAHWRPSFAELRNAMPAMALLFAAIQAARGQLLPSAWSLLLYFMDDHSRNAAANHRFDS